GTMETVKQYVARGLGIGVVSGICLTERDHGELQAVEIPKEFQGESTYGVVLRKDKYLTAALRGLLPMVGVGTT
ncbi:MAG: LysR family transcriptional regulator substrate-binding protein, partial [Chloroflexi bacterium]|nr:LysR family transcriptional regulator substrate-binding protein [Chloroflexota bacterium]MCI0823948.1 LysR family transcriptional regulator substrate-binding protein [Chloroflexota bacterium]